MKRTFMIFMMIMSIGFSKGQNVTDRVQEGDAFCRMINEIFSLKAVNFRSELRVKNLFESDTIISAAEINLKKKGSIIEMLQIVPDDGEKELLFCRDSSWLVDHMAETMVFIGKSVKALSNNALSSFFPFSVFDLDTNVYNVIPFWKLIYQDEEISVIDLVIGSQSPELSDIKVLFTINNSNFLLAGTSQEYTYLNIVKGCEKLCIMDYSFPDPSALKIPEYYTIYGKDLSLEANEEMMAEIHASDSGDIFLDNIELFDLQGKSFNIPDEGLSFFDLWYAGCAPCIKSAQVVERLYRSYKDEMYFFSVNELDSDTLKIKQFGEKMGLSMPVLRANHGQISSNIATTSGYPLFFILDNSSRKILWQRTGYSDDLDKVITDAINKYL